jgi:predicted CoA-binding protein
VSYLDFPLIETVKQNVAGFALLLVPFTFCKHTVVSIHYLDYTRGHKDTTGGFSMSVQEQIDSFLAAAAFGVAGASSNRQKYGNRVLRCYMQNGKRAVPVNPKESEIEGIACVTSVDQLPSDVTSLSMITPPAVTELLVPMAIAHGIKNIWMQPGAESPAAVALCRESGVNVIADGSCLLVVLGYHGH